MVTWSRLTHPSGVSYQNADVTRRLGDGPGRIEGRHLSDPLSPCQPVAKAVANVVANVVSTAGCKGWAQPLDSTFGTPSATPEPRWAGRPGAGIREVTKH
jgi:hypothetical protein